MYLIFCSFIYISEKISEIKKPPTHRERLRFLYVSHPSQCQ